MSEHRSPKGAAQDILSIGSIMRLEDAGLEIVFKGQIQELTEEIRRLKDAQCVFCRILEKFWKP